MKKGFTLVELLAVIIILGVILVIAIPSFNNAIKESKIKLYKSINQMVVKSTKEYLTEYVYELPKEEGETIEVTTNDLIANGYLKEISNPTDKNDTCTGYVLITKLENNEYSYNPHINCEEDINNSTEDGLVLHYTFDDFQEPTVNLVPNSTIFNNGWSPYGSGNDGTFVTEFGTEGLNIVNRISWTGAYKSITLPSPGTYTLSVWVKVISRTHTNINCNLYTSGGGIGDTSVSASWSPDKIGQWQKIEMTRTYLTNLIRLYLISYGGAQEEQYRVSVQYTMPQIEQKAYATPFVNGSRTGTVKDYSINNNNAPLSEITTPRWTDQSYSFDGINDTIIIPNLGFTQNVFTVSMWIKPSQSLSTRSFFLTPQSAGIDHYLEYDSANQKVNLV
ncbi:MAG: prepilin-type N-terminal cleavage/methylation domain-containing protein, partial [Bacilli bacterium]|nr:prepilin-type N-terminal cleavage/methylation domain-containing protein [Bacilli bacterium]